jgi:4-hydroxybenzoate polyprenyltransferase
MHHPTCALAEMPWAAVAAVYLLGWASNVSTALPDAPPDRAAGKRTYPVRFGDAVARRHMLTATLLAALVAGGGVAVLRGSWAVRAVTAAVVLATLALRWSRYLLGAPDVAADPLACGVAVASLALLHATLLGSWTAAALLLL